MSQVDQTMGKNKNKVKETLESPTQPILELSYKEPLFQLVCHPSRPLIFSGLATGHLYCHEYDVKVLEKLLSDRKQEGGEKVVRPWMKVDAENVDTEGVRVIWKTRRHLGSVRCLCVDAQGTFIFSVGTDNVLKKAHAETGKVVQKISLKDHEAKFTKLIKSSTHPYLLLGDECGTVLIIDSNTLVLKNQIKQIHGGDAINDIFQFAKRSVHKYVSLGQTTLAYWDARESRELEKEELSENKSNVLVSDDQEDEVLCGAFVDPEEGDTLVCGMGEGILTVWKPKKNDLEDQLNRIKVSKGESIDALVPTLQDDQCVWCGVSDGKLYKVDTKRGQVIEIREHDEADEAVFLDLDYNYRLVSGGMESVLIWSSDAPSHEDDSDGAAGKDQFSDQSSRSSSDEDSDNDSSDTSGEELTGLSREELIAELDKEIEEKELENNDEKEKTKEENNLQSGKRKRKEKLSVRTKAPRGDHGIAKFEGL